MPVTRYLYPQSDVTTTGWVLNGSGTGAWDRINDVDDDPAAGAAASVTDGDTTECSNEAHDEPLLVGLDGDIPEDAVEITVTWRAWMKLSPSATVMHEVLPAIKSGGSVAYGDIVNVSDLVTYLLFEWEMEENPLTLAPWTGAEVNALAIGAELLNSYVWPVQLSTLEAQVAYTPGPVTGDWSGSTGCRHLAVDAAGVVPPGGRTITGYAWDWDDGTPAGSGAQALHKYAAPGTYAVVLTVTLDTGETRVLPAHSVTITEEAFTTALTDLFVVVDAASVVAPTGYPITSYVWAWGDGWPGGSGLTDVHRYAVSGTFFLSLTVTLTGGSTYTLTQEVQPTMFSVTSGLTAQTKDNLIFDAAAIYFNYGIVGQERKLGATRGGARFRLNRVIREIPVDGTKGRVKGLRRIERVEPEISAQMLELTVRNLIDCIAGAASEEVGETTVITGGEITDASYIANVALVGRVSGSSTPAICLIKNALPETEFDLNTVDRDEPVVEIRFTGHFEAETPDEEPWELIFPTTTGSGSGS